MEIVAAIADNGVIGANGDMPWHLPADLTHFRELTSGHGHALVMGRRTWESIGKALPHRINIVITRQQDYEAIRATVVHSLEEVTGVVGANRIFVIGGGEIYAMALATATHLHLTRIHAKPDGDTYFPEIDTTRWVCCKSREHPADEKNSYSLTFETWVWAE